VLKEVAARKHGAALVSKAVCLCMLSATMARAQTKFEIGISVHLGGDPGRISSQLSLARQAGASSIRDDVPWAQVEQQKGHLAIPPGIDDLVNQTLKAGLQPLLILDYGNPFYDSGDKPLSPEALSAFARYAVFVTQHFKGRVRMYEMWNEWNGMVGKTHRGTPQDYVRFLKVVYPAVKAADPSAIFIGGAIGGLKLDWLSSMLSAGGVGFFDALSIHPYNFDQPARTADAWAREMVTTETVIHTYTGGRDLPLYITEMGWPTYSGPGASSLKEQATFLAQMFLLARTMPFLKGIWWYDLRDDGWNRNDKEDNFGLTDPNLRPKPAFVALEAVAPVVRDALTAQELSTHIPFLCVVKFNLPGNKQALALWNADQSGMIRVHVTGASPLQIRSTQPGSPDGSAKAPGASEQTVEVSDSPVLITATGLSLKSAN
jgi:hypothetical protein